MVLFQLQGDEADKHSKQHTETANAALLSVLHKGETGTI